MATNNVKIYLNIADKLDHLDRMQQVKYNRKARRIGFKDLEQAAITAEVEAMCGNYMLENILIQFFDSVPKPYRNTDVKTNDYQRIKYLQSYGFSKSIARKYLRFGIEIS